jgi:hypothetical protein
MIFVHFCTIVFLQMWPVGRFQDLSSLHGFIIIKQHLNDYKL